MKINFVLRQLQDNICDYGSFWSDWIQNEDCSLTDEDIYTIDIHKRNNFTLNLIDSFMFYNQTKHIERINAKLRWDSKKFKEWIILNFLFGVVEMARSNGGQNYLHQPIGSLELREELKSSLLKLNILYLNQIFENYREEDFEKEKVFKSIMEFETLTKKKLTSLEQLQLN